MFTKFIETICCYFRYLNTLIPGYEFRKFLVEIAQKNMIRKLLHAKHHEIYIRLKVITGFSKFWYLFYQLAVLN